MRCNHALTRCLCNKNSDMTNSDISDCRKKTRAKLQTVKFDNAITYSGIHTPYNKN